MNWIDYFDLNRDFKRVPRPQDDVSQLHWIPQWIAVVAGITIQPFFTAFRTTGVLDFTGLPGWFLFSLVVGVLIFPGVYRGSFDPGKPVVIQIFPLFAAGMGWESLIGTAARGLSAVASAP